MRLQQHINESGDPLNINIIDNLMKVNIDYLKDVKKLLGQRRHYLTRGVHGLSDYIVKQTRQDRKPTDSNLIWHNALNAAFKKKFGIEARSKSVFCAKLSSGYGSHNYMVLPIGDFYMLYSPVYPDLFLEQPTDVYQMETKADQVLKTIVKSTDWVSVYNNTQPITEIMVVCQSYLMVKENYTASLDTWIRNEVE